MPKEFSPQYNPKETEDLIYRVWEDSGFFDPNRLPKRFAPGLSNGRKKTFTTVVPPPNITGSLHMGHALNATIQDILIRKKRMEGFKTLWLPGTDHAGIATQNVVEKDLKKRGISRHDLGREKFLEGVWEWKEKYGNTILEQFKKLGASMDWSRTRFTMDSEYRDAVKKAFIHYYKKGWIYRGERAVNWCVRCSTSLSDLEIEYKEEDTTMYYIKYGPLVIATVRPETKLGDTAIAVNPKDKRYKEFIGQELEIQTVLGPSKMKVIGDEGVDMEFGTGAMKVTPAHDLRDFELSEKHKLEKKQVIGADGKMTEKAGKYAGLKVKEARERIAEDMKEIGILIKTEPYKHNVAICYRCGTILEPILSEQWFVKMEELAKKAVAAVEEKNVKFYPERWEKVYFDWLAGVRDWCVSRQIWWGHQIPAWHCSPDEAIKKMGFYEDIVPQVLKGKKGRTYRLNDHDYKAGDLIALENSQVKILFGHAIIENIERKKIKDIQLPDPIHGGGYQTPDELLAAFRRHYPPEREITEDTETIIYDFKFIPFSQDNPSGGCGNIFVGEKKPKTCPNCEEKNLMQDPDVLDTWFSSALWPFATLGWPQKTKDLENFYPTQTLSTARDIINLWVSRMVFSGMEFMADVPFKDVIIHATILTKDGKRMSKSLGTGIDPMDLIQKYGADATRFGLIWQTMGGQDIHWSEEHVVAGRKFANKLWNMSRFIFSKNPNGWTAKRPKVKDKESRRFLERFNAIIKSADQEMEKYNFGQALHSIYEFAWHDFADKYIEYAKIKNTDETGKTLRFALISLLKLLHPFMPFITETVWSRLPIKNKKLLMIEEWPLTGIKK